MKNFLIKAKNGICTAISWLFAIPSVLFLLISVFFGIIMHFFDKETYIKINRFFNYQADSSEKRLDDKIKELKMFGFEIYEMEIPENFVIFGEKQTIFKNDKILSKKIYEEPLFTRKQKVKIKI